MALDTVSDYVNEARVLLQDLVEPYRYTDAELVVALNIAMQSAYRVRPDLFLSIRTFPSFTAKDATAVPMDIRYRSSLVFFITGYAQLRDDEVNQDSRAAAFMNKFDAQLLATL